MCINKTFFKKRYRQCYTQSFLNTPEKISTGYSLLERKKVTPIKTTLYFNVFKTILTCYVHAA